MSNEYHNDREWTSQSMIKSLDESAATFAARYIHGTLVDKDTKAKKLGRVVHGYTLQADEFSELFPIMPRYELDAGNVTKDKIPKRTASKSTEYYKTKKKEFFEQNASKDIIDDFLLLKARAIRQAIGEHPDAVTILENADAFEVVHRWIDRGLKRRCMMDIPAPAIGVIGDIKVMAGPPTTINFARHSAKFRWWTQAPWYLRAADDKYGPGECTRFVFICVNAEPPHQVACHEFDDEIDSSWSLNKGLSDLDWAKERVEELVDELLARRAANDWTDRWARGINKVPLPRYSRSTFYDVEEEAEEEAAE